MIAVQLGMWQPPFHECRGGHGLVTCADYEALRARANDRCEVCRSRAEDVQKRRLYIDHDSRIGTGRDHVRGLLCAGCNTRLRYVDNGYKRATPAQQKYLDNSWFWDHLPQLHQGRPFIPIECRNYNTCAAGRTWQDLEIRIKGGHYYKLTLSIPDEYVDWYIAERRGKVPLR